MKSKKMFLYFAIFMLFNITTINRVSATTYELNTQEGTQLALDVKVDTINDISGQMTMEITSLTSTGGHWNVKWKIIFNQLEVSRNQVVYEIPASDGDGFDFLLQPDMVCPTPVSEYLTEMADSLGSHWEASDNSIIFTSGSINRTMTYDVYSGLLSYYVYGDGSSVYQEYVMVGIPGYDISIVLFISGFSIIGLIYLYRRRRKEEVFT